MNKIDEKQDISKDKSDVPSNDDASYIDEEEIVETNDFKNFEEVRPIKNSNPLLHVIYFDFLYSLFLEQVLLLFCSSIFFQFI